MRKQLLKDWTNEQTNIAEQKIAKYFGMSFSYLEKRLGLPYTSSSSLAGFWVCNYTEYFDKQNRFYIRAFALDQENNLVIYCLDNEENELFVTIK